jgi:drug/metabolite transporter (DMT)-like permease
MLWVWITLLAAGGQVLRNAMQKSLTGQLGTSGATYVRFVFGLPFGVLFFLGVWTHFGFTLPTPQPGFWPWIVFGAVTQIAATGFMLAAMKSNSLVITTAIVKTEPVQVAVFAAIFLGDYLSPALWAAVIVATVGVVLLSLPAKGEVLEFNSAESRRAIGLGVISAALFALASVGFRGAVTHLGDSHFVLRATTTLVLGLLIQTSLICVYLFVRDQQLLRRLFKLWKPCMVGGFMGAFGSQMWFIAFALATVAQVRTLALVEIFFALILSKKLFAQGTSGKDMLAMGMIALGAAGVILLK